MSKYWSAALVLGLLGLLGTSAAKAQEWKYIVAGEGPRLLYHIPQRENESFPLYVYCDLRTKQFVAAATLGVLRARPSNASFSIGIPGEQPVVLSGKAGDMPYNDEYWMEATFSRQNPLFNVLQRDRSMVYSGGAIKSFTMSTRGLSAALQQFLTACR